MTGRILTGLSSGRKKEVKNAEKLGKMWMTQLQQAMDMQEELLFDGELKVGFGEELDDFEEESDEFGEESEEFI